MSKKVLSFGDTVLTELELSFLEPGQWLNDNIIHFYFEYEPSRLFCGALYQSLISLYYYFSWLTESWKNPAKLLLVCPSTMFLIQMTGTFFCAHCLLQTLCT